MVASPSRYNSVMMQSYVPVSPAAGLLQLARLKGGLSQGQLAERAGVPATMISAYERDKRQPTLATLLGLLEAAGFELRMQLAPHDPHDEVLAELETRRSQRDRNRRNRQIAAWRQAERVTDP
jgi:transcriptional regulator with XRE-family HTH domain